MKKIILLLTLFFSFALSTFAYDDYEETNDCVNGIVVYEGKDDYYIVETQRGYTILEWYKGRLYEGDKVRGELNRYKFHYILNKSRDCEVRVYIEDWGLSEQNALNWMKEHNKLK